MALSLIHYTKLYPVDTCEDTKTSLCIPHATLPCTYTLTHS